MNIALLQLNPIVGDLDGNAAAIAAAARAAAATGAALCVTSELALTGYPPRDLLCGTDFTARTWAALQKLAADLAGLPPVLVGVVEPNTSGVGNPVYNTAALCQGGAVVSRYRKRLLPTYDVFDEQRYFEPGPAFQQDAIIQVDGLRVGVTVCEDIWNDKDFWQSGRRYAEDPLERLAATGAHCIVNLSSSPFTVGKQAVRRPMLAAAAAKYRLPILYCNQVGGNDDLVFDGKSMVFDATGRLVAKAAGFTPDILCVDTAALSDLPELTETERMEDNAWNALVLGTRDYVRKCGFAKGVIGLSGGVDSALVAAIAVEALGPDNVLGVMMPSPFSSPGSVTDAEALAHNLGIATLTLPIADIMASFDRALAAPFAGRAPDVTEENIQSRIRGNLLMALSNKSGAMLLTTGNKSELAVGYCTIYGDMAGGLAVIADVPKTLVYALCHRLNALRGDTIPTTILTKAPSAELRPGQKDQDSLPPYDILDPILERLIVHQESAAAITAAGFDPATVAHVLRLVRIAEFKRRQAPPGLKITDRAFGSGWRMPIACKSSE
ncbi:MAG: NAD+ synthase [Desulfovibrionaceae bacterium]